MVVLLLREEAVVVRASDGVVGRVGSPRLLLDWRKRVDVARPKKGREAPLGCVCVSVCVSRLGLLPKAVAVKLAGALIMDKRRSASAVPLTRRAPRGLPTADGRWRLRESVMLWLALPLFAALRLWVDYNQSIYRTVDGRGRYC